MTSQRQAFGKVCAALALVVAGCGEVTQGSSSASGGAGAGVTEPPADPLTPMPCEPWRASDANWSSLPSSRPAAIGAISASPSGDYLYAVSTWFDAGRVARQIVRSHDLGQTWCVLATPRAIATVAPSRSDESVLYALTAEEDGDSTTLLQTVDGGATWTVRSELPKPVARDDGSTVTLQTSMLDSAALWIHHYNSSSANEVYVSDDGGQTWAAPYPPGFEPPVREDPETGDWIVTQVTGLVVDPKTARRVLAFGHIDRLSAAAGPLRWFSSEDLGATWRELGPPPLPVDSEPSAVFADAGSTLYLSQGSTLFRSVDWGKTWTAPENLPGPARPTPLGARSPGQLYAWPEGASAPIWATTDAGSTWRTLAVDDDFTTEPVLAPKGTDVLIGRGRATISTTTGKGKWNHGPLLPRPNVLTQSLIDGRIWASGDFASSPAEDSSELESRDGALTWARTARPQGPFLMDGASANTALAELGSFGSQQAASTEDGGQTWSVVGIPSGGVVASAACRPPLSCYLLLLRYFGAEPACRLARSDDRGRTWMDDRPLPEELCYFDQLAISPDGPEHLLGACSGGVCETRDGGKSWEHRVLGRDTSLTSLVFLDDGSALTSFREVPPGDPQRVRVARSADGGAHWSEVLNQDGHLLPSATRPETVFLISRTVSGADLLWRSDDSGASWAPVFPTDPQAASDSNLHLTSIADAPGGFVAATSYGLVHFE